MLFDEESFKAYDIDAKSAERQFKLEDYLTICISDVTVKNVKSILNQKNNYNLIYQNLQENKELVENENNEVSE